MKKILFITVLIILTAVTAISVFALDAPSVTVEEDVTYGETIVSTASSESREKASDTSFYLTKSGEEQGESLASYIMSKIIENASLIVSSVGVFLILTFKKSLVPIISSGVTRLTGIAKESSDNSSFAINEMISLVDNMKQELSLNGKLIENGNEKLYEISDGISKIAIEAENAKREREVVKSVMLMQSGIFESLIRSSTLPQWRKDQIEEEFALCKKALAMLDASDS